MCKIKIYLAFFVSLVVSSSYAQSIEDLHSMSKVERTHRSARVAAMGGAFTSLGADISSININPAGLGMYRSSEFAITPSLSVNTVKSSVYDFDGERFGNLYGDFKSRKVSTNLNNLGGVINLINNRRSGGILKALNIAYSIEQNSTVSTKRYVESPSSNISIGDYFAAQLYGYNVADISTENFANNPEIFRNMPVSHWGAVMAYNTWMVDHVTGSNPPSYVVDDQALAYTDLVNPQQDMRESVSTLYSSFAIGANIGDKLYLGVTLGVYSFSLSRYSNYQEFGVEGNVQELINLRYEQESYMSGSAFDFKVGATLVPVNGVRIGVAYHAPATTSSPVTDEYLANMATDFGVDQFDQFTPIDVLEYGFTRPASLLAGISFANKKGIISFDYERTWYNKMKVFDLSGSNYINDDISYIYRPTNSFMVGAEYRPLGPLYVRGGYAYHSSPFSSDYEPDRSYGSTNVLSLGVGFRYENIGVDIAYISSIYKTLPTLYYDGVFVDPQDPNYDVVVSAPSAVESKYSNDIVSATFIFRF